MIINEHVRAIIVRFVLHTLRIHLPPSLVQKHVLSRARIFMEKWRGKNQNLDILGRDDNVIG